VRRLEIALVLLGLPSLSFVLGCGDDGPGDEMLAVDSETGDGDGDPGDGDGDGEPGDGDGDPGDGDGDGDPGDGDGDPGDGDGEPECIYPDAAEPMALDEPIAAYAWPLAIHADGTHTPLDLEQAHCDTDAIIDWSPHEILVFISIPAW
jgi:hypothetical protein